MKTIGIVANALKPAAAETVRRLRQLLRKAGVETLLDEGTAKLVGVKSTRRVVDLAAMAEMLIVLGGDGTLLRVARELNGAPTPMLGVNLGGLGFLTSIPQEQLERAVKAVVRGQYDVSRRTTLHMRLLRGARVVAEADALNDVVFSRSEVSRVVRIELLVDGNFLAEYAADGIIFATPTGSTAYSLSAEGPILQPETTAFVITPICPHPISYRSLVVPHPTVVTARALTAVGKPLVTVDGQVQIPLCAGDVVEVRGGQRIVQLVTLRGRTYYDVLREKLKWSGSTR